MKNIIFISLILCNLFAYSQIDTSKKVVAPKPNKDLKFNLNEDGSNWFQVTVLNQTWARFNQNNPGTLVNKEAQDNTFDIGLRRTRFQLFGQVTDKVFVYFQLGQNNFNAQTNYSDAGGGNRKAPAFFIHDAYSEYKVFKDNKLKLGGGLTIANGLSRFSQPSIGTIATMDVPVFAQATVDQTDQFSRKLSLVARGQIGKLDYRASLSNPFPILNNGSASSAPKTSATFAQKGHHLQYQTYLLYQFFDHEQHNTPYMTGAYLGKKKVFNVGGGIIYQKNALWKQGQTVKDTLYQDMTLICLESFLDIPLNKEKGTALNAYAGYFNTNYGTKYLRFNGLMNPATSTSATNTLDAKTAYGNALPMFGTGHVIYTQVAYFLPKNLLGENHGALMPYISNTFSIYKALGNNNTNVFNAGINWLINNHKAKLTLDYQNRPTYYLNGTDVKSGDRKGCLVLQYQIFI